MVGSAVEIAVCMMMSWQSQERCKQYYQLECAKHIHYDCGREDQPKFGPSLESCVRPWRRLLLRFHQSLKPLESANIMQQSVWFAIRTVLSGEPIIYIRWFAVVEHEQMLERV